MTAYTLSLDTIDSSFAPPVVNTGHSPFYHYHDCNCFTCQDNHRFYCGDLNCLYCQIIGRMLYIGEIESSSEAVSYSEFLAYDSDYFYDTFELMGHVYKNLNVFKNTEYLIKYFCIECNDRIGYDTYDGKELCVACQENSVIYCAECGTNEVEDDGDLCLACGTYYCCECGESEVNEEGDICDYCSSESNHGYVVSEDEYEWVNEAWIAPNGDLYIVDSDSGGHDTAAKLMGFRDTDACENAGYIHLTDAYGCDFEYVPDNYTDDQVQTVMTLCEIKEWAFPDFVQEWLDRGTVVEETLITFDNVQKMQNLNPSWLAMPRKQRDIFYPLSGD